MSSLKLETLGDLADDGYRFNVWCTSCQRGGLLPVEPFVTKLGRAHDMNVRGHIKCSKCGSRDIEVRINPPAPEI